MSSIDIRLTKARSQLVMDHAFFGALIMRMAMVESRALKDKTMATDGTSIWYHPLFLEEVSERELLGVLVHELFHCILGHHVRRGDRDHNLWNRSCDYVVNLMVTGAGFTLPKWALIDRQYDGLNAEQVYRLLGDQQDQDQEQDDAGQSNQSGDSDDQSGGNDDSSNGQPGDGQDAGVDQPGDGSVEGRGGDDTESRGDPGRCGEILDAAPAHDKAALSEAEGEWEVAVRQAVNIAKRQGNVPGFVKEIVDHLNDPQVDWTEVLNRFVDPATTKDYSWMNPSRRMLPFGHYTPGLVSDGVSHVGMVVDSSGSVDTAILAKVGAEVQGALDTGRIDRLTVIFCDTRVTKHDEYVTGDVIDWTVPGRGGTAFSPAFGWINENAPDIQCAIYFTDMQCADYGVAPAYPVLWAAYGDPRTLKPLMSAAPFGECIDVNQ